MNVILRSVTKHVAHQLDTLQADCDGKAGVILGLERENAAMAKEIWRLQGVIRDLQADLDAAHSENVRLERPDRDD